METFRAQLDAFDHKITERYLRQLEHLCLGPAEVTLGWPISNNIIASELLRDRLIYWPGGLPKLRMTAIVSSRLGRQLDRKDDLFRVLRIACGQLDPRTQMLLCATGTSISSFVRRAAFLFGLSLCRVEIADQRQATSKWVSSLQPSDPSLGDFPCFVSPALETSTEAESLPLRDRVEVCLPDQVLAVHVRNQGNLERVLATRLERQNAKVFLALGSEQLVAPSVAEPLMSQGGIGWLAQADGADEALPFERRIEQQVAPRIAVPKTRPWPYLTHCTRRPHGKWPDQEEHEYLDELILGQPSRERSNLSALLRIVGTRTLLATGAAIRGGQKVVSFSAAHLDELLSQRTFRSHRGRWDFEPYGICIHRDFLVQHGAQEVVYGTDETWERLSPAERPFFQKTADASQESGIDWRAELEWRMVGDLDLERVPPEAGFVFVPSEVEARHVSRLSRWPVAVVQP